MTKSEDPDTLKRTGFLNNYFSMDEKQLENIRHSAAHMLAAAVLELYPGAKLAIGPTIENGFYYDFLFPNGMVISENDLEKIEETMKKISRGHHTFVGHKVTADEAREEEKDQPFKLELINEFAGGGQELTMYESGPFKDLCRGGHVENTKEIPLDGLKLHKVAGAYWRGSEKNPMLTRIYGLLFSSKEELDTYLFQLEEAKKRDHRKLGKELELFTIIDEIGPGLPLFYPKGATLRRLVENYITEEQEKRGYVSIWIPHITKGKLYEISGHLDKYDAMYTPMCIDEENYYLKPMNCPHFMMLFRSLPHSYKELPLRYTCTTTNYRYEKSGELSGLTRVRSLTQDDCHVFCESTQIETEISVMLNMIRDVYKTFTFDNFYVRVSLHDPKNKQKYLGGDDVWEIAENALRNVVKATGWKYVEEEGEAAFYGPKLDFMVKDVIGREWQLSTIQLDFNLPQRFDLDYTSKEGAKARPVVIHRAILGSTERFLGIMIEHFGGAFPVWLSPVQVHLLPVSSKHLEGALQIATELRNNGLRVAIDEADETVGKKVRNAVGQKTPYIIVVGDKELSGEEWMIRVRGEKDQAQMSKEDFMEKVVRETKARIA